MFIRVIRAFVQSRSFGQATDHTDETRIHPLRGAHNLMRTRANDATILPRAAAFPWRARIGVALLGALLVAGCSARPEAAEALAALRAAMPAVDTSQVWVTVWRDGPAYFSCAEIRVKLRRGARAPAVSDSLRPWLPLEKSGWVTLRDTAAGEVADPGWCAIRPAPAHQLEMERWAEVIGGEHPATGRRHGWLFPAGVRRIVLRDDPRPSGRDSATVDFAIVVAPNASGRAAGADRDTIPLVGVLVRAGERWRLAGLQSPSVAD